MNHTPLTKGYIAVTGIPEDAELIQISNGRLGYMWMETWHENILPPGQWELIGVGRELTEGDWDKIVEREGKPIAGIDFYKDYEDGGFIFAIATPSGLSLLQSLSLDPGCVILKKIK